MHDEPSIERQQFCRKAASVCAGIAIGIGVAGFLGWVTDSDLLKRIHPSWVTMKFNTAICLIFLGVALELQVTRNRSRTVELVAATLSMVVAVVGAITFVEHLTGRDLKIDQLFFKETVAEAGMSFPGRMGVASTLALVCLGIALARIDAVVRGRSVAQWLAGCASVLVMLVFLYYFYGVEQFPAINRYATIAAHTVIAFFCLCVGVFFARPNCGVMVTILGDNVGSVVARWMLLPAFLLPLLIGWLRVLGQDAGFYGPGFGRAILTLAIMITFSALIWWTARALNQMDATRREQEQRLGFFIEYAPSALAMLDRQMCYVAASNRWKEDYRINVTDLIGRSHYDLFPELPERWKEVHRRALTGEVLRADEDPFERADGTTQWIKWETRPWYLHNGEIGGILMAAEDITARVLAKQALQESEDRFRTLGDNISQLTWMTNADGWIFWYNKRWYEYTGTTLEQMQGWGWSKVHHPDHCDRVTNKWKQCLNDGLPWEDTFPLRSKTGEFRWFLSRAVPIRDASGKILHWFGTNTDITELRDTQLALQKAQADLQSHADNLERTVAARTAELKETNEQLEAFVYSIAHDLRAPLRAMQGYSGMLIEEEAALPAQSKIFLGKVHQSAEYMDKMILDLLAFGRAARTEIQLGTVDLKRVWDDVIYQCAGQIEQTAAVVEVASPFINVRAHDATLTQVLANLLGNALKFVEPGKTPHVRFRCEDTGHSVRLWVEDNGVGIDPKYHSRVFRVFERLHGHKYPGTGIGLSIVRKGVERMNGNIGLESDVGKGTRFWVELPKA